MTHLLSELWQTDDAVGVVAKCGLDCSWKCGNGRAVSAEQDLSSAWKNVVSCFRFVFVF